MDRRKLEKRYELITWASALSAKSGKYYQVEYVMSVEKIQEENPDQPEVEEVYDTAMIESCGGYNESTRDASGWKSL
tara:strand:- start:6360 stop:6590 length:231 start_codon:yes stop_codon:yes gene_type:complete